jgi:cytochrome c oxidase assembly factor CtaG
VSALLPVIGLAVVGALYAHAAWRLQARRAHGARHARWRNASFLGGTTVVAGALVSPLDQAADVSVAAHMVQHLLLVAVGAPLLALGRPLAVLGVAGSPARPIARRAAPLVRRLLERPVHVWTLHTAVLWLWHLPRPYMAALSDPRVHALEHLTLLAAGVLFWLVIVEPGLPARLGSAPAACYLFGAAMQCGVLGALLTLSDTPWYPASASVGAEPLVDQQLAGVLMWVPASLVYLGATLAVVARPLRVANGRPG